MARVKIPARYVDLEIMGLRTKTGKETVIVLDAFDPDNPKPIQERIDDFGHIEVAGADIRNGRTYRVWNIWFSGIHKACDIMKHANNQNMEIIFEGLVIKDMNEKSYPFTRKPYWNSQGWLKYRFEDPFNG